MYRYALENLKEWAKRDVHKPLILRGARQVGKSFLARMLANEAFETLAEINFEQMPDAAELFKSKQPERIIPLLELKLNLSIVPGKTLLFLDEIQAAPEVIASLRYFYEQIPHLHIIAAGSLLEFVLENHQFSMPVGRIEYMHLGPMTFEEFLLAMSKPKLLEFIQNYSFKTEIPDTIHNELLRYIKDFFVVGGMPEAVKEYSKTKSYLESQRVLSSILATYRNDFSKYGHHVNNQRIEKVFSKVPNLVGSKFRYSQIDREEKSRDIKHAIHLLECARIVYKVLHSDANGLPLGAEENERYFKIVFLDVGLLCRGCGLTMEDLQTSDDFMMINSGAVCEQFVAQHLLYSGKYYEDPQLFCWLRQYGSSSAEVDYLFPQGSCIIPVEAKAGKSGKLKSLQVFVSEKHCKFALRFYTGVPLINSVKTSVAGLEQVDFKLMSLPLYLIGQTKRLCREFI